MRMSIKEDNPCLKFDFCPFCMVIRFFHPRHNGEWPPTLKDFYTRSYPLHYFLILILRKSQFFPFSMLSAKLRYYWYHLIHLWYDAVLDWGLNPGPPALEASTLPLGYRGGGSENIQGRLLFVLDSSIQYDLTHSSSLIVNWSCSNTYLDATSSEQWGYRFLLKKTKEAIYRSQTHKQEYFAIFLILWFKYCQLIPCFPFSKIM